MSWSETPQRPDTDDELKYCSREIFIFAEYFDTACQKPTQEQMIVSEQIIPEKSILNLDG